MKFRKMDYLLFYLITFVILFMNLVNPIKPKDIFYILLLSIVPALMLGTLTSISLSSKRKLLVFCGLLIVFSILAYSIDSKLVAKDKRPIFVMPLAVAQDGGTTIYSGVGYKVIGWNMLQVKMIDGKEVSGIMTGYEISTWFHAQDINNGPQKELKFISNSNNEQAEAASNQDSLKLQMENKNFKFYSFDKDTKCLEDLAKALDENYNRISKDLKITLKDKIEIEVYPDIDAYHKAIGAPDAPNWAVGTGWGNKIKMVSPLNPGGQHTYDTLMMVVVHEFTHVLESSLNSSLDSIPIWLNEGVAAFEAKQMTSNSKAALADKIGKNEIPALFDINVSNISTVGGYVFSYTAIEYIVNKYGYDSLISLIKNPGDFSKILGVSSLEFDKSWRDYLKENYK